MGGAHRQSDRRRSGAQNETSFADFHWHPPFRSHTQQVRR